ncbi:hypothetical protein BOX15_Mlig001632g4 [Macrostomum lignano]|uniref:Uncharacterized protein n=2 Tax=Macrostomum lignano TaxID=282301 RepID=A0A267G021_9PLAT|nr:hypothetical protein BOX15_Mlig001632g4 [Macrostomum lignano]
MSRKKGDHAADATGAGSGVDFKRCIERHLRDWERRNGEVAVQFAREAMASDGSVSAAVNRAVLELLALDKEEQRAQFDDKVDSVVQSVPAAVHQQIKAFIAQMDSKRRPESAGRK